jgi:predicted nucleic acid-binding protein
MVTIAELEMGVLAADEATTRARRLKTLKAAEASEPLPITRTIAAHFAQLVTTMRKRGQARLKIQDAWIAATALDWDAELWTQDGDFAAVPGLHVIRL